MKKERHSRSLCKAWIAGLANHKIIHPGFVSA